MPLHRNESSSQKTLNLTGFDTYVKENYNLSRERVTVYTQASSDPEIKLGICIQRKRDAYYTKSSSRHTFSMGP